MQVVLSTTVTKVFRFGPSLSRLFEQSGPPK